MRFAASALLALSLSATYTSPSNADLRHYSSRLIDAGGNEALIDIAGSLDGGMFVELQLDSIGTLGGVAGPGLLLARFDAAGGLVWSRRVPTYAFIAAVPDGGIVLTGGFQGIANFGGADLVAPNTDVFLVKLDQDGGLQWQRRFGSNQIQRALGVDVDPQGNIIITGSNALNIDFGGGIIRSNGGEDAFLAKFDADAGHLWSRGFGFSGSQFGISVDAGDDGRIALAIVFGGASVDFGAGQIYNVGGQDVAAAVFDGSGALGYSIHAGSPFMETSIDATFDAQGNLFLVGAMVSALDLGGGTLPPSRPNSTNGFAASYDRTGAHRWSWEIPDTEGSGVIGAGADDLGNCFMLAVNRGPFKFGLDDLTPSQSLVLGFRTDGGPLDAIGFSQAQMVLRMNPPRDRILLGVSVTGKIDFGGGPLVANGADVALAAMGVYQPASVSIEQFDACDVSGGVRVSWNLSSAEPLGNLWLSRRVDEAPEAEVLYSTPAVDGEASFLDRTAKPGRLNAYRLTVATALGDEKVSDWLFVTPALAVNSLEQNSPNPFNPLTTFVYSLSAPADVSVVIYDTHGAVIARLEQGMQPAGRHQATWGGHNMSGEFVASGVYYYRLEGAGVPDMGARKMLLLK